MTAQSNLILRVVALLVLLCARSLSATTIDFSTTTASNWLATAGGATNVPAWQLGTHISITSNAFSTGTFLPGGAIANFDGFWTATYSFSLPANATNVTLVYSNIVADDRAVLLLNGNAIGAAGTKTVAGTNSGFMVLADGGALQPWTFYGSDGDLGGVVSTGFIPGATNTLQAIVNNTHNGFAATSLTDLTATDGTTFRVQGFIDYVTNPPASNNASLNFTTASATNWLVTAGNITNVTPWQFGARLAITSNSLSNGAFLPGGSYATFDGFWTARYTFFVPSGASNALLVYSNLYADDRVVLTLNGTPIGATGTRTGVGTNPGFMCFADDGSYDAFQFTGTNSPVFGANTSAFIIGGTNVLQAILNNTDNGIIATNLKTLVAAGDATFFGVDGTISYSFTAPSLTITQSGAAVTVSWPTNYSGFQLQTTTGLGNPGAWSTLTTSNCIYTTVPGGQPHFFRLVE